MKDSAKIDKNLEQVFGKACGGYLLGEAADEWISQYIRQHHGDQDSSGKELKMKIIFQPDTETQIPDRVTTKNFDAIPSMCCVFRPANAYACNGWMFELDHWRVSVRTKHR